MDKILVFRKLLRNFSALPKSDNGPTFMEICRMGGDRFEERCSRILSFFLLPTGKHKLKGLLLTSLLEAIGHADIPFHSHSTRVITEEMTDNGKKIDITVISDSFVIAIENKIEASLYNPLESYVRHIVETYPERSRQLFVILSVKKITDSCEIDKIRRNGYIYINYSDLFDAVKRNLGRYAAGADPAYLTFLLDFIRTIEKRYNNTDMELKRFFYENLSAVNSLITEFNTFNNEILQRRKEIIAHLRKRISDATGAEWTVWQGWDLYISFNDAGNRLGIECSFNDGTFDNPIGDFHIYITVWNRKHFVPYEADLKAAYPYCRIDYDAFGGSRVFLHLPVIHGHDSNEILGSLSQCYNTVKLIADRHC